MVSKTNGLELIRQIFSNLDERFAASPLTSDKTFSEERASRVFRNMPSTGIAGIIKKVPGLGQVINFGAKKAARDNQRALKKLPDSFKFNAALEAQKRGEIGPQTLNKVLDAARRSENPDDVRKAIQLQLGEDDVQVDMRTIHHDIEALANMDASSPDNVDVAGRIKDARKLMELRETDFRRYTEELEKFASTNPKGKIGERISNFLNSIFGEGE